jgi:hypothetical protein
MTLAWKGHSESNNSAFSPGWQNPIPAIYLLCNGDLSQVCNFHSTGIKTGMRQRQIISEDDLALADRFVLEDRSGPELNDNKRKPRQEIDRL